MNTIVKTLAAIEGINPEDINLDPVVLFYTVKNPFLKEICKMSLNRDIKDTDFFNEFTDPRDNRTYKTMIIGEQEWFAENLAFNIPCSHTYKNDDSNGKVYGRLYTLNAAKKAIPKGWKLPSMEDWFQLCESIGGLLNGAKILKSPAMGGSDFGFNALPAGWGEPHNIDIGIQHEAKFWTRTGSSNKIYQAIIRMTAKDDAVTKDLMYNKMYLSVRCVRKAKEFLLI